MIKFETNLEVIQVVLNFKSECLDKNIILQLKTLLGVKSRADSQNLQKIFSFQMVDCHTWKIKTDFLAKIMFTTDTRKNFQKNLLICEAEIEKDNLFFNCLILILRGYRRRLQLLYQMPGL